MLLNTSVKHIDEQDNFKERIVTLCTVYILSVTMTGVQYTHNIISQVILVYFQASNNTENLSNQYI